LYDTSSAPSAIAATRIDQATDERVAEEFKREFLDAQHTRGVQQIAVRKKSKAGNKVPKGPRLSGSRSARAAMHAALQKGAVDGAKK
jgi:hypothetical protein